MGIGRSVMDLVEWSSGGVDRPEGWIRKNLKAWVRSRGFEIMHLRNAGAAGVSTRLIRPGRSPAAQPQPSPPRPGKYFTIDVEARPGINHLRFALELLVREAVSLGRTPIAFKPRFDPRHNLGHDLDVTWDRYIDLERIELRDGASGTSTWVRAVQAHDIPQAAGLSAARFERGHVVQQTENERFDLIVRHNRTGLHVDGVHDGAAGLPGCTVRFQPAKAVRDLAARVQARLGTFCAMHVRRDDMLEHKDQYPNLDRDTQPDRIRETLQRHLHSGSRVYIMTNERNKQFFEPLRESFEVVQYFDFPELRELIECSTPDNFLLFEVEKLLFEHAATQVYTFTHPEGGKRISLSSDLGWA